MYTLESVLVRKNKGWSNIDFSATTVMNLISTYDSILITILAPGTLIASQYSLLDFPLIRATDPTVLISDYFSSYAGFIPTPITPIKSLTNASHLMYSSIWEFGLQADRGTYSNAVIRDNVNFKPDIVISKPTNYPHELSTLQNNILYLVNGIVFFDTIANANAYLINASYALDRYSNQHISVLDFSPLGGFTNVILTTSNTTLFNSTSTNAVLQVQLPIGMSGVTPILIRNGNLHILDGTYTQYSDTEISIQIDYLNILSEAVGMSASELTWVSPSDAAGSGFSMASINPLNYLTSGNSSILLVNTSELSINTTNLLPVGFTQRYATATLPKGILKLADGTIGDYMVSNVTDYGIELSTTSPKLINALKDTIIPGTVTGVNMDSSTMANTTSTAVLLDLYVI